MSCFAFYLLGSCMKRDVINICRKTWEDNNDFLGPWSICTYLQETVEFQNWKGS